MEDPFDGLTLDDSFVAGARIVEPSAAERMPAPVPLPAPAPRPSRPPRRRAALSQRGRNALAIVAVMAGIVWVATDRNRSEGGLPGFDRPPSGVESADAPLGRPEAVAVLDGSFAFAQVQADGATPVAYDPCRPIHVVVNDRAAPRNGAAILDDALAGVSRATGLVFVVDGPTDEAPSDDRPPFQPDRYGQRWAPVLVAWSDAATTPELAGAVAGRAGSAAVQVDRDGPLVYVTGTVTLDGPDLALAAPSQAVDIARHELAHLVGLDHVDDPGQLMFPTTVLGVSGFQAGDLTGLAALGGGECRPEV